MDSIQVFVKHQGKKYEVQVDPSSNGETFKYQLYSLTGVQPDRQKILVKGGRLKDDADMSKLGLRTGATLMMMGVPEEGFQAIERPKEKIKFLEDMTEAEQAQTEGAIPAGLQNLGNTCYMNSTLQTLKSIPELQEQLRNYSGSSNNSQPSPFSFAGSAGMGGSIDLTASLRDLFKQMSDTQEGFPPILFLQALRRAFPQFAQRSRDGHGFAQQDAEEAYSQILSQIRPNLKIKEAVNGEEKEINFVDKYMAGKFDSSMECDETEAREKGEKPIETTETFYKLNCHINVDTNHLRDGLAAGLTEKIEKHSETLGRDAIYTKISRISRLPKHLTVHFVRFDWRRTTNKKAKIMRKVTFPQELDAVEFCSEELKKVLLPVRDKIRDIRKEEEDVERARKRQRRMRNGEENDISASENNAKGKAIGAVTEEDLAKQKDDKKAGGGDTAMTDAPYKTDAEWEAEKAASLRVAKKELLRLVDSRLAADDGANQTGLYELRGVITHQGASADSGHYTAFVRKAARGIDPITGRPKEEDGKWWWFNDDKVSEVSAEHIATLQGGGQSHAALILLYRAVPLPHLESESKETASA